MHLTHSQKYQIAQKRLAVKQKRKEIFKILPVDGKSNVTRIMKIMQLDKLRFDLKGMERYGQFQQDKNNNGAA